MTQVEATAATFSAALDLASPQLASAAVCHGTGAPAHAGPLEQKELFGAMREYAADDTIYRQHDTADHWYLIVNGAARKCTQISDGRRQIMDFLLPGDLFGFETAVRRKCSVECVAADTTVVRYQRLRMESLMDTNPGLSRRVRDIAFGSLDRLQSRMILLGCSCALERVCGFLMEMAHRAQMGIEGTVTLPMSRYDIADYLAIAVETVSRSLTTLRSERVITFFDARHFRVVNRQALEAHCCR
jgi:CRP/FNR family transcriptional regulator, nitrogen fixation regulation protein